MIRVRLLVDREVTVFSADLDAQDPLDHLLSPDELERAARFRFPELRRRYIAGRGVLRALLGEREGVDPASLRFRYGAYGKPRLVSRPEVAFNLSHSEDAALVAFASDGTDVGVDIEAIRHVDPVELCEHYFSDEECAELWDLHPAHRLDAFFQGWVRKEAVIKADGRGVSLPLDSFSVSLDGPPLLTVPPPEPPDASWWLRSIDVGDSARAAVALREVSELGASPATDEAA